MKPMENHLKIIRTATSNLTGPPARNDQALADLIHALCKAMAAQVPPADAAAAANMSLGELFTTLRKHNQKMRPIPLLTETSTSPPAHTN